MLCLLVIATASSTAYCRSISAQLGYDHSGFRYELAAGYEGRWFDASVIAADDIENTADLLLMQLNAQRWGAEFSLGRIGVSLGIDPPAYAGRPAMPQQANIHSRLTGLVVDSLGVPNLGLSAAWPQGAWRWQLSAYKTREVPVRSAEFVTEQQRSRFLQPLLASNGACTALPWLCQIVSQQGVENVDLNDIFLRQFIGSEQTVAKQRAWHLGAYYAGRADVAFDYVRLSDSYLSVAAIAYTLAPYYVRHTLIKTRQQTGVITTFQAPVRSGEVYLKMGYLNGAIAGSEYSAGYIWRKGRWALSLGVEAYEVDFLGLPADAAFVTYGVGYEF